MPKLLARGSRKGVQAPPLSLPAEALLGGIRLGKEEHPFLVDQRAHVTNPNVVSGAVFGALRPRCPPEFAPVDQRQADDLVAIDKEHASIARTH